MSHAESIRKFRILPVDFTEDTGELTPTMKVKRKVVAEKFASDIEALYSEDYRVSSSPAARRGVVPSPLLDGPIAGRPRPSAPPESGSARIRLTASTIWSTERPSTT